MKNEGKIIASAVVISVLAAAIFFGTRFLGPQEEKLSAEESAKIETEAKGAAVMLLADKYNKEIANVSVAITGVSRNHVRGTVKFSSGEEGIILASNVYGDWNLVFEGNGQVNCAAVQAFQFPEKLIEECNL